MTAMGDGGATAAGARMPWGFFLVTGIAWVIVSILVLAADATSVLTIAWMVTFVLVVAGINELMLAVVVDGWRWAHALLGAAFIVTGISALADPMQTFGILALLIGWYLVLKGTFDIIFGIARRDELPLWGLFLASGVVELIIGVWALGYPGRSAWLLILWVGVGALMRGLTEIATAFHVRHATHGHHPRPGAATVPAV
jgi:uncharacterized membrane protein HdeD (DUF308 family)